MSDNQLKITLTGNNQLYNIRKTSYLLCEPVAKFIFIHPHFLEFAQQIIFTCISKKLYNCSFNNIISINDFSYPHLETNEFVRLFRNFYEQSTDVENDRGKIVEILCFYGIKKNYDSFQDSEIKCHSKVKVEYNSYICSTHPKDIDVCGKRPIQGDYVECKISLTETSDNDNKKIDYYKKTWPTMKFLNIEEFKTQFVV